MATPDDIADAYTRRALTLLRAAEGEALHVARELKKATDPVLRAVAETMERPSLTGINAAVLKAEQLLGKFFNDQLPPELRAMQREIIAREAAYNSITLGRALTDDDLTQAGPLFDPRALAEGVAGATGTVTLEQIARRASRRPYQGARFSTHFAKAHPGKVRQIESILRGAFVSGESVADVTARIKGTLNALDRDTKTLVRSYVMHNATEAKESVFSINSNVVTGYVWVSTLDSRTTPLICGVRDGREYDRNFDPVGHGEDWDAGPGRIHWNCRSTSAPIVRGATGNSPRPSIAPGANYERGDNKNTRGRVRKPTKPARDAGIYKTQIRTTATRYEGWLREQSRKNLDFAADVLGSKEKARAFRDGKVTLSQLGAESPVSNPTGRGSA